MNAPEPSLICRPLPTKFRAYEAVYWLNRFFEATLLAFEQLEEIGIFHLESLNEFKVRVEHIRAEANEELIDTLHEQEMGDSARFDQMQRRWENGRKDPDDVFFHARERREEIKEQMKNLKKGLQRQSAGRKVQKKHRP